MVGEPNDKEGSPLRSSDTSEIGSVQWFGQNEFYAGRTGCWIRPCSSPENDPSRKHDLLYQLTGQSETKELTLQAEVFNENGVRIGRYNAGHAPKLPRATSTSAKGGQKATILGYNQNLTGAAVSDYDVTGSRPRGGISPEQLCDRVRFRIADHTLRSRRKPPVCHLGRSSVDDDCSTCTIANRRSILLQLPLPIAARAHANHRNAGDKQPDSFHNPP